MRLIALFMPEQHARARQHEIGRGEGVREARLVLQQRVARDLAGCVQRVPGLPVVAVPGAVEHVVAALGQGPIEERLQRCEVDGGGALAAPEDQQAAVVGGDAEAPPGIGAVGVGDRRGNRPARDHVALSVASWLKHVRNVVADPFHTAAFLAHWTRRRILAERKFPSIIVRPRRPDPPMTRSRPSWPPSA